jgi:hypothetical protein
MGSCDPVPASSSSSSADLAVAAPRASWISARAAAPRRCHDRPFVNAVCSGAAPESGPVLGSAISNRGLVPFDDECCTATGDGCNARTARGHSMTRSQPNRAMSSSLRSRPMSLRIIQARMDLRRLLRAAATSRSRARGDPPLRRIEPKCEMKTPPPARGGRCENARADGHCSARRRTSLWNPPARRGTRPGRLVLARVSTGDRRSLRCGHDGPEPRKLRVGKCQWLMTSTSAAIAKDTGDTHRR